MENCLNSYENKVFLSETEKSILVYSQNSGNLHVIDNKEELNDLLEKIGKQEERKSVFLKTDQEVFKLNLSTICNLNCDYCFRDKSNPIQTDVEKAKKIIDFIIDDYMPHVWMYCFSVNLTSESLVEFDKIKQIKQYLDERTQPGFREKDFKDLATAQKYLDCFPPSLVNNFSEKNNIAAIAKLLDSFLDKKDLVTYFPFPEGMTLPKWEADRFANLENLSGYDLREFNLRFLEAIFPETILRKPHYAFYICTNGTVYSDEVVDFFKEIELESISISLDGPSSVHNLHRFFMDNYASHKIIIENIQKYMQAGLKVNVTAVLTKDYPYPLQLVEYFKQLGVSSIEMNAVRAGSSGSFDEVTVEKLLNGYEVLFNRLYEDIVGGNYELVELLKNDSIFAGTCFLLSKSRIIKRCKWNENTIFDAEGNIYPCDYFIGNAKYLRGNIKSTKVEDVFENKLLVDDRENCRDCWCKYLCGGTCYYNSLKNTGDIGLPDPVECKLNKGLREKSVKFVHKLIDSGINLLEFRKRLGFVFNENVVVDRSFFVKNGLIFSIKGTLTRIELEVSKIFEQLAQNNVDYSKDVYFSVVGKKETNSNSILEITVIVQTTKKLPKDILNQFNCVGVNGFDFGFCLSGETSSVETEVEKLRQSLSGDAKKYQIPVNSFFWYLGTIDAFLGYKKEKISVFLQCIKDVY